MARQTVFVLALVVACAASPAAAGQTRPEKAGGQPSSKGDQPRTAANKPEDRERWKWWLYDRAELGITDQQSQAINEIFEATLPRLRASRQELDAAEKELSRTIKEHTADLAVVSLQLDRVEHARSHHSKLRTLMLYRMHLILSADQRAKLEALRARRDSDRRDRDSQPGHRYRP